MKQAPAQPAAKAETSASLAAAETAGSLAAADASEAASNSISNTIVSSKPPVKVVCVSGTRCPWQF